MLGPNIWIWLPFAIFIITIRDTAIPEPDFDIQSDTGYLAKYLAGPMKKSKIIGTNSKGSFLVINHAHVLREKIKKLSEQRDI